MSPRRTAAERQTLRRSATSPGCSAPMPGHSTAAKSNELYRKQPRQGPDRPLHRLRSADADRLRHRPRAGPRRGRQGRRAGRAHLGDMRALLDDIPLDADEHVDDDQRHGRLAAGALRRRRRRAGRAARPSCTGTIQNDIIKEYLSRGTYVFPPEPSLRLIKDTIVFTTREMPKWNPTNVCSYHLQEAGATPVQELAFALATAHRRARRACKASGEVPPEEFGAVVGRISFFVNAGLRFVTEICKMRAFTELWDEISARALRRHRPQAPPVPLRRAGQLAGPHRAAAGEQRLPHPDRDAGRDAVEERARPRRAAAGLERGAGPAAAVGPAVVAPHAADPRLRDRPARVRRHLRRLDGDRRARSTS